MVRDFDSPRRLEMTLSQIYEDAMAKYAAIQKSITHVLNEAYSVLYRHSKAISVDEPAPAVGTIFAVNNIPDYPRQEVVSVPLKAHGGIKSSSAQISKDGKTGYVLVDATRDGEPMIGLPKGLYADVTRVSGEMTKTETAGLTNT